MRRLINILQQMAQLYPDDSDMNIRITFVERNLLLPLKTILLPLVIWYALSCLWTGFNGMERTITYWDQTMYFVYLGFLFYAFMTIPWGILIWDMNNLKKWQCRLVLYTGIGLDVMFIALGMVASRGFDSPAFWIFSLLVVRNSISLQTLYQQVTANGILCLLYILAGWYEIWVISADGFRHEDFVQPVMIRIFFLLMLSICSSGVHLTLTKQKQIKLEAQEFLLRQEQIRANGRLAAEIAHQLKNPLGIINNIVYIIKKKNERGQSDIEPQLRIIREEIERSDRIITDLMGYAKLVEGSLERLDLNHEVDVVLDHVFPKGSNFGIKVIKNCTPGLPLLFMQREHLSEIITNLVMNARDILKNSGTITVQTRFSKDYCVILEVIDDGPGIEEALFEQIWTPYFTTKEKGTGLGLSIVKHNTEMYGGHVTLFSHPGEGTCFTVELPATSILKVK